MKQESTVCATGDELELSRALEEPKIRKASTEQIKGALRYAMLVVGLRQQNMPAEEEKAVLIAFIVENYGGHTPSEIMLAFKMAIAGKLQVEEVNCYENFSVLYFSRIMNAYREWAKQAVQHVPKKQLEAPSLPSISTTDQEFIEACRNLYRLHKDFKQIPVLCYKTIGLNPSRPEKDAIKKRVQDIMIANPDQLQDLCKQYAVKLHFDGLE